MELAVHAPPRPVTDRRERLPSLRPGSAIRLGNGEAALLFAEGTPLRKNSERLPLSRSRGRKAQRNNKEKRRPHRLVLINGLWR